MRKNRFITLFTLALLGGFLFCTQGATAATNIFDHTSADRLTSIPNAAITAASNTRVMLRRASVGGNINDGLNALQAQNSLYNRSKWDFQERGNPGWAAKIDEFGMQLPLQLNNFDVFSMKFCFVDGDASWTIYRDKMLSLEAKYPTKKFIWWTLPLSITGYAGYDSFNSQVRSYAKANNKILFDIADIESEGGRNSSGLEIPKMTYVGKLSDGTGDDWGHLNSAGSLRLAKAFWVMMATISSPSDTIAHSVSTSLTKKSGRHR